MRFILAVLLMLASPVIACEGTKPVFGVNAVGAWVGWWCDNGYTIEPRLYAVRTEAVTPALTADLDKLSEAPNLSAAIDAMLQVHGTAHIHDDALAEVYLNDWGRWLVTQPSEPVWRVAKLGDAIDRPAFRHEAGIRAKYSRAGERAVVGELCDARVRIVEGSTVYAKVAEGLVAICKRQP